MPQLTITLSPVAMTALVNRAGSLAFEVAASVILTEALDDQIRMDDEEVDDL